MLSMETYSPSQGKIELDPRSDPLDWIVNLVDRQVEVYASPNSAGYSSRLDFHPGENVPVVVDAVQVGSIAVDDIMP